ncbi:MAG: ABC transporter ATP-binding protein [Deltaproteobacteria bacterium]
MSKSIITVEHLSKRYRLGQIGATTLRHSVQRFVDRVRSKTLDLRHQALDWRRKAVGRAQEAGSAPFDLGLKSNVHGLMSAPQDFWALKDVSFEVQTGEVLGIIGRNGAGKSTLLKILSRITEPTRGRAIMRGRVASLLEVGTGFHPELSGRENIYLNGAILGMRHAEIVRKFDEIVAFAEVEKFIDTPVKHYSSGMYVRLAFSVAAHLEPEILVVDEVLAVGDVAFQKKCMGKMGDVANQGRTILFVSHNMIAMKQLCKKAYWLNSGCLQNYGFSNDVIDAYLRSESGSSSRAEWIASRRLSSHDTAQLSRIHLVDSIGRPLSHCEVGLPFIVEIDYLVTKSGAKINLSLSMHNGDDIHVFASPSVSDSDWFQRPHSKGRYRSHCAIPGDLLNHGRYYFTVLLVEEVTIVEQLNKVISLDVFETTEGRGAWSGNWGGVVRPSLQWQTTRLPSV